METARGALGLSSLFLMIASGCSDATPAETDDPATGGSQAAGGTPMSQGGESASGGTGGGVSGVGGAGGEGEDSLIDQGRNVPEGKQVAFFLGQDSTTLGDFHEEVLQTGEAGFPAPRGVTLYTAILPSELHENTAPEGANLYLGGIEGPPVDQGNGDVDFEATLATYDAAAGKPVGLAVGLYLSDEWAGCGNQPLRALIDNGDEDLGELSDPNSLTSQWRGALDRLIVWFKEQERPVYLRIGYEFDGPWNCYNQDFYKQAFRYIKERIDALGANNVATVWQAATYPDEGAAEYNYDLTGGPDSVDPEGHIRAHYEEWYPGDDVVDWVGLSFFSGAQYEDYQWSCPSEAEPWTIADTSPRLLQDILAQFGRQHHKPVMIAESAPQGFDHAALTSSCVAKREDHLPGRTFPQVSALYDAFFSDYFAWMRDNADVVRLFSYINTNWQGQSRWACAPMATSCPQGYWGDTRLEAQGDLLEEFATELETAPFSAPF